jgi:uncharacterized protein with PIN domain
MLKNCSVRKEKRVILADVMLAKVARWLRLAGIAAKDVPEQGDDAILRYTKSTKATLLTSDVALSLRAKKRGIKALLVVQQDLDGQLAYIISELRLRVQADASQTLCPGCGIKLRTAGPDFAENKGLPESIYSRYNEFYSCRKCGKLYWQGSHWRTIARRLSRVSELAVKNSSL